MQKLYLGLGVILVALASMGYWMYSRIYLTTDDAYVNANVVQIAARVTGQVARLAIRNNQFVNKGQLLFELDTDPFITAVHQAQAQYAINQAKLILAQATERRTRDLVKKKVASEQEGDGTKASLIAAMAQIDLDKANLRQAELNLQYTHIIAPASGWVTNVTLREGDTVSANQPLFALISNEEFWVDANFKETELHYIRVGQKADIKVDMYPGHRFSGIVESISGGSGTAFSLLPSENATGNWVKVAQRVPVRVKVNSIDTDFPLRVGTSAEVRLHL
jgi:membrane fusion protein (multidrug efflux system)